VIWALLGFPISTIKSAMGPVLLAILKPLPASPLNHPKVVSTRDSKFAITQLFRFATERRGIPRQQGGSMSYADVIDDNGGQCCERSLISRFGNEVVSILGDIAENSGRGTLSARIWALSEGDLSQFGKLLDSREGLSSAC
jgi:hypothetical protein